MGKLKEVIFFIIYLVLYSMTDLSNIYLIFFIVKFGSGGGANRGTPSKIGQKSMRKPHLHGFQLP